MEMSLFSKTASTLENKDSKALPRVSPEMMPAMKICVCVRSSQTYLHVIRMQCRL